MKISKVNCNFEREPLSGPFGFKGSYMNEIWQSIAYMQSEKGCEAVCPGTQGVLWSDAGVFLSTSESAGNAMMFLVTSYGLKLAQDIEWENPMELLDVLLPKVYEYAKKVTCNEKLRLTFALNSLVAVDNAAWQLYCKEKGLTDFDAMIPEDIRGALAYKHDKLACIPLMSYGVGIGEIKQAVDDGYFFLKIKIGSDPDKDGDYGKMLEWDKRRLEDIHNLVKDVQIPYTETGHIPYYLDANGRYDSKERLMKLLDHADKIGALERLMIVEEPFPEEYKVDVSDVPVRLAADESAHSDKDAAERIELGYSAIALKPIAKTMSMSLKIAKIAHDKKIPCFCADLTVSPILVDWNKTMAARLAPLPGMKVGVLESNGHQNYKNWEQMKSHHPCSGAGWTEIRKGLFHLDKDFYARSGGIFDISPHYRDLVIS